MLLPRCVGDVKAGVVRTLLEQDGGMELKLWWLVPGAYWMCPADGVPWGGISHQQYKYGWQQIHPGEQPLNPGARSRLCGLSEGGA